MGRWTARQARQFGAWLKPEFRYLGRAQAPGVIRQDAADHGVGSMRILCGWPAGFSCLQK
jgi:hypothetical protein